MRLRTIICIAFAMLLATASARAEDVDVSTFDIAGIGVGADAHDAKTTLEDAGWHFYKVENETLKVNKAVFDYPLNWTFVKGKETLVIEFQSPSSLQQPIGSIYRIEYHLPKHDANEQWVEQMTAKVFAKYGQPTTPAASLGCQDHDNWWKSGPVEQQVSHFQLRMQIGCRGLTLSLRTRLIDSRNKLRKAMAERAPTTDSSF